MKTAHRTAKVEGRIQFNREPTRAEANSGFSLIELLVVIGVIVLLAALTFPIIGAVRRAQTMSRTRAELAHIETAIEAYKTKLGYYPPDNPLTPADWTKNQLFFELSGTTVTLDSSGKPSVYQTLDGSASIAVGNFATAFGTGTKVAGFMNCTQPGAGDDARRATKFLAGLKAAQFLKVESLKTTVLGVSMSGWPVLTGQTGEIVPYGYNSSNPQHNPKSFDLWVDIYVDGKTNRVNNWSTRPTIVYYTSMANSYP